MHEIRRRWRTTNQPDRPISFNRNTATLFVEMIVKGTKKAEGLLVELAWDANKDHKPNAAEHFETDQIATLAARAAELNAAGHNVYVGPALRKASIVKGKRTTKDDIEKSRLAWADLDKGQLEATLVALKAKGLAPRCVTITGRKPELRGHIYFAIKSDTDLATIRALNVQLRDMFDGDPVQDVSRVMRLPGSIAWPRKEGRVKELTSSWKEHSEAFVYIATSLQGKLVANTVVEAHAASAATPMSRWAAAALEREAATVGRAAVGQRNSTLNRAAFRLGQLVGGGLLDREVVRTALDAVGRQIGLAESEVAATVRSGMDAGAKKPRGPISTALASQLGGTADFELREDGIYRIGKDKPEFICSRMVVEARVRNGASKGWGYLVLAEDPDKIAGRLIIPGTAFVSQEWRRLLLDRGADVRAPGLVQDYLQKAKPTRRIITVNSLGWADSDCSAFLWGGQVIGDPNFMLSPDVVNHNIEEYRESGSLKTWKKNVATPAVGNPMLVFALSAGFSSPLLQLLGAEPGGFHFVGVSSIGKTSLLRMASSIWGSQSLMQTWSATHNALEGIAAEANGTTLCLDEINQGEGGDIARAAYTLANGRSKGRANKFGDAQSRQQWNVTFLSTGETTLAAVAAEAHKQVRAGQEVRLVNIPVERYAHGVFNDLHGAENGAAFADAIKAATGTYFGVAGPAFVEGILRDPATAKASCKATMASFVEVALKGYEQSAVDGQVRRVAQRFALVAAAGQLATEQGVTGWEKAASIKAALSVFKFWVKDRGGVGAGEKMSAIDRTRRYLSKYGMTFLLPGAPQNAATFVGWRDDSYFYITADVWREIHAGADAEQAGRYLFDAGLMKRDGRHLTVKKRKMRCYAVSVRILQSGKVPFGRQS